MMAWERRANRNSKGSETGQTIQSAGLERKRLACISTRLELRWASETLALQSVASSSDGALRILSLLGKQHAGGVRTGHVRTREMKYNPPHAKITIGVQTAGAAGNKACSPSC